MAREKKLILLGALFLLILSTIVSFLNLGTRSLWSSEGRWAVIAREMSEHNNFFRPTINNELYYDKPLLSYWMVVASNSITGNWSEFTVRFPFALSVVFTTLMVYIIGLFLFDLKKAFFAGVILTTSYGSMFFSHVAQADTLTVLWASMSMFFLYLTYITFHKRYMLGFWVISCISCLCKGLIGLALPIAVGGLFLTIEFALQHQEEKKITFYSFGVGIKKATLFFLHPISLVSFLVGLAVLMAPFLIAPTEGMEGLRLLWKENVVRFFKAYDHRGSWLTYFKSIPRFFAPWIVLLPASLLFKKKEWLAERGLRFILIWAVGTWIFFQCSSSRRSYYIIPILPPLALIVAQLAELSQEKLKKDNFWISILLVVVLITGGILLIAFKAILPVQFLLGIVCILLGITFGMMVHFFPIQKNFYLLFSGLALLFILFFWGVFTPWGEQFRPMGQFYKNKKIQKLIQNKNLALYQVSRDSSHVYYLHRKKAVPHFWKEKKLLNFLNFTPKSMIILNLKKWKDLTQKSPHIYRKFFIYLPRYQSLPFKPKTKDNLLLLSKKPLINY